MCGIFAFVAAPGRSAGPDPATLHLVAGLAATRGPHGCGWAWLQGPSLLTHRLAAPLSAHLADLALDVAGCWALIGQARLATFGGRSAEDGQPCVVSGAYGRVALVHNGNAYNAADLAAHAGTRPRTGNDSEAVALYLAATADRSLDRWLAGALDAIADAGPHGAPVPQALVALSEDGLGWAVGAVRRGHPLWLAERPEGVYLCSRPFPTARELADRTPYIWRVA